MGKEERGANLFPSRSNPEKHRVSPPVHSLGLTSNTLGTRTGQASPPGLFYVHKRPDFNNIENHGGHHHFGGIRTGMFGDVFPNRIQ